MKTAHDREVHMTHKQHNRIVRAIALTAPRGLFGPRSLAAYLDVDVSTVLRWAESGILPRPVEIDPPGQDGSVAIRRWTKATIDAWLDLGCPSCEPPAECEFTRWRSDWVCEDLAGRVWASEKNCDDNAA